MAEATPEPPNHDLTDELPEDIKVKILEKLPIKEAVRSSILSKSWRYTWTKITKLKIRDSVFSSSESLINFMDIFLLLHTGQIVEFLLDTEFISHEVLDRWIYILSGKNIQELSLAINSTDGKYQISYCFYSCHALKTVQFDGCVMDVPLTFSGFKLLKTLKLNHVEIDDSSIKRLISRSSSLEKLDLLISAECLEICAPNLKELFVCRYFGHLYLETPNLVYAILNLGEVNYNCEMKERSGTDLSRALSRVPDIQKLWICFGPSKNTTIQHSRKISPLRLNKLMEISLAMDISNHYEISFAIFLCENAPNLQVLDLCLTSITSMENETRNIISLLDSKSHNDILFMKLKTMEVVTWEMVTYSSDDNELLMAFLKFFLVAAPVLEKLSVPESLSELKTRLELMKSQWLSNKVEIVLLSED